MKPIQKFVKSFVKSAVGDLQRQVSKNICKKSPYKNVITVS